MKYAQIKNGVVISIMTKPTEGRILVPENVACGMIQNADGTFRNPVPTQEQLMHRVRFERNELLSQTDWWVLPDRTATQAQLDYRQALRDITNQTPSLDSDGNLTGITWPIPPND